MMFKNLSKGLFVGSKLLQLSQAGSYFGGCNIVADGTNVATVTIRAGSAEGEIIFNHKTKNSLSVLEPFSACSATALHCTVSGTGAELEVYEYIT